jgi:hypothetical protein
MNVAQVPFAMGSSADLAESEVPDAVLGDSDPSSALTPFEQLSAKATEIYGSRLRSLLEQNHLGEMVAIHPESGDYEVGKNSPTARRHLRGRHPAGFIVTMSIGPERPEPTLDRVLSV